MGYPVVLIEAPQFDRLPRDVLGMIWEFALTDLGYENGPSTEARTIDLILNRQARLPRVGEGDFIHNEFTYSSPSQPDLRPLRTVNRQANAEIKRLYRIWRRSRPNDEYVQFDDGYRIYFHPQVDTFFLDLETMLNLVLYGNGGLFDDAPAVLARISKRHGLDKVQRLAIPGIQTDLLQSAAVILMTLDMGQFFTSVDTPVPFPVLDPVAPGPPDSFPPLPPTPNGVQIVMPLKYRDYKSVHALVQELRGELLALQKTVVDDGSWRSQMLLALFSPILERVERYVHGWFDI